MSNNKVENYWEYESADGGHKDTREQNFNCETPDPSLGCDLGIDVQG